MKTATLRLVASLLWKFEYLLCFFFLTCHFGLNKNTYRSGSTMLGATDEDGPSLADLLKQSMVLKSDTIYKGWDWSAVETILQRLLDDTQVSFDEVYRTGFFAVLQKFYSPTGQHPEKKGSSKSPRHSKARLISDVNDLKFEDATPTGFGVLG